MAVANTKSTVITNADTEGGTINFSAQAKGVVYTAVGTVEVAAADDNNSVYRFCRVPSNARIVSIRMSCDAITGGTDYNVGLWQTAANGGLVLSENCYADAVDLSSGFKDTEIRFEGRDVANIAKRVYEDGGLSTDPKRDYDICAIGIAVGSGAGTISVEVQYTV